MPESIEAAVQQMAALFVDRSRAEQKALLAALERAGAAVYRSLAASETDERMREGLRQAASREEENAELLEDGG